MKKTKKSFKIFEIFAVVIISLAFVTTATAADALVPLGHTAGIKIASDGAMVIGISEDVPQNPCKEAGIAPGDVIKSIDGKPICTNSELRHAVTESGGRCLDIEYVRNGETVCTKVTPVKGADDQYVIGIRIRDGIAGIGTMTYFDPQDGSYGALGHGVSDGDTNVLVPVEHGTLMRSTVADVKKGEPGNPGELIGDFAGDSDFADVRKNTDGGIFGKVLDKSELTTQKEYPIAEKNEIKRGKATILTNIEDDEVREYEIEITSIYFDGEKTKNMLIRATDPELISKTGGIVRGMSGSPILQNGKIVGAITHVLVNNPQKGYAIFIENMLDMAA